MKKLDLGQIVTLLANLGVIAGIVFLAIELQQNNDLLSSQARAYRHELRSTDANRAIYNNPELAETMRKARNNEPLSETEMYVRERYERQHTQNWQFAYVEYQNGALDIEELPVIGWCQTLRNFPGLFDRWERGREDSFLLPDFVEFMDENVLTAC